MRLVRTRPRSFPLHSLHSLKHQENIALTGVKLFAGFSFPLLCSEFRCSGCIRSVSCLYYHTVKGTFRRQMFRLMLQDIFIRKVLSFTVFLATWHSTVLWQLSKSNETRANPYTRSWDMDKTSSSVDTWLTKRPDRISASALEGTQSTHWNGRKCILTGPWKRKSDFDCSYISQIFSNTRRK